MPTSAAVYRHTERSTCCIAKGSHLQCLPVDGVEIAFCEAESPKTGKKLRSPNKKKIGHPEDSDK